MQQVFTAWMPFCHRTNIVRALRKTKSIGMKCGKIFHWTSSFLDLSIPYGRDAAHTYKLRANTVALRNIIVHIYQYFSNIFSKLPWLPIFWHRSINTFTCYVQQVLFSVRINTDHSCIITNLCKNSAL